MRPVARDRCAVPRARAARRRRGARGFTLVEILVVIVIIGILTVGMMLSVNLTGRDADLEKESQRLTDLVNYTREQAELQTREYGLLAYEDSYQFVAYDVHRNMWRSVDGDDSLRARKLPSGLTLTLVVDGRQVVLKPATADNKPKTIDKLKTDEDKLKIGIGETLQTSDAKDNVAPQVMIYSSGDLSSFELTVLRDSASRSVTIHEDDKGEVVTKPMVEGGRK